MLTDDEDVAQADWANEGVGPGREEEDGGGEAGERANEGSDRAGKEGAGDGGDETTADRREQVEPAGLHRERTRRSELEANEKEGRAELRARGGRHARTVDEGGSSFGATAYSRRRRPTTSAPE